MENRDCEKVLELLSAYIDGELSESDAEFVRAHLEICPDCKKVYDELKETENIFAASSEDAPLELSAAVMTRVRAEKAISAKRRKFTRIFGGIAVAAVISLTVLASPAILLIASGGAKAECDDMAVNFAPSASGSDNFYSDQRAETEIALDDRLYDENGKYDGFKDVIESIEESNTEQSSFILTDGKKYTANLADGTSTPISFEGDIAIFDGEKYEYKISGDVLYISNGERTISFGIIEDGKKIYFKEIGKTND